MQHATIRLTSDGYWALYAGDGSDPNSDLLAVGALFEPGAVMREAVAALEAWAVRHGYHLVTPVFGGQNLPLDDLMEADGCDDLFGTDEGG